MALHCGGRVPVSWLLLRYLRPGGGCAYAGGCKQKGREGVGLKRTRAVRGRLGAHSTSRLVMALHCGGRVPVSWLLLRYLRPGGGHACAGGKRDEKGLGSRGQERGGGRLGAHRSYSYRLAMALHCGGRVPVSWLLSRYLRTGGGCVFIRAVVNKRDEKGLGSRGQVRGGGRLGAHRSYRLVMVLHCGGRVPVSWLSWRYLRTGGGHAYAGGCKQKGTRRGWAQENKSGERGGLALTGNTDWSWRSTAEGGSP